MCGSELTQQKTLQMYLFVMYVFNNINFPFKSHFVLCQAQSKFQLWLDWVNYIITVPIVHHNPTRKSIKKVSNDLVWFDMVYQTKSLNFRHADRNAKTRQLAYNPKLDITYFS